MANAVHKPQPVEGSRLSSGRILFVVTAAAALVYALLAGLRTVADFDLGWQLATARWIVQHHQIPSTDVLSYTALGQPWIYPVGSGLIFLGAFSLGGYALLSWLGAAACVATIALLLRRGTAWTAAIAILAVPLIANRTTPRADMFTVVLFAAFFSLLWEHYETGRARLWLLPLLTAGWANLHLGLVSGIALFGGYALLELLDMLQPAKRQTAMEHLRRAWPWFALTPLAALVNPWGWKNYSHLLNFMTPMAAATTSKQQIAEWAPAHLSWNLIKFGLWPRCPDSFVLLLFVVAIAVPVALLRRQIGAALLLCGATFFALRHLRLQVLFAVIVVIIAGAVLSSAVNAISEATVDRRSRSIAAVSGCAVLVLLVTVWCADLATNRYHMQRIDISEFGTGLSWWFPTRAAEFMEREGIPGQLFNTYNEGGFVAWRLGPKYPNYVDGRGDPFGARIVGQSAELVGTAPDANAWKETAGQYNINSMLVPISRFDGLQLFPLLRQYCTSETWKPVYMDEVSVVFVRATAQNAELLKRLQISCETAPLPATAPAGNNSAAFNQWLNAANVLMALGRNSEAYTAATRALAVFPDSPYGRFLRGEILEQAGALNDAEKEYLAAVDHPSNALLAQWIWVRLAEIYGAERRFNESIAAWKQVVDLTPEPHIAQLSLGFVYSNAGQPGEALKTFEQAEASAKESSADGTEVDKLFYANLAHGRTVAYEAAGDLNRATEQAEEAVRVAPEQREYWIALVGLYNRQGRYAEAQRATERMSGVTAASPR